MRATQGLKPAFFLAWARSLKKSFVSRGHYPGG